MTSILAVPGIRNTTPEFRAKLLEIAERHGWDVDAIAAVISRESGFKAGAKNALPGQTAVGLIQFTMGTLRGLGWQGSREGFAELSAVDQLRFVERYYERAFPNFAPSRPVDYYLATWGARAGLPLDHVLATEGQNVYSLNSALDLNKDGSIKVEDLAEAIQRTMDRAGGERLSADPKAPEAGASRPSYLPAPLPTLRLGSSGSAVRALTKLIGLSSRDLFDQGVENAVRIYQEGKKLKVDGIVGPKTWAEVTR